MGEADQGSPKSEWTVVRVAAAFSGLRFLPWWLGTASNSAHHKRQFRTGSLLLSSWLAAVIATISIVERANFGFGLTGGSSSRRSQADRKSFKRVRR